MTVRYQTNSAPILNQLEQNDKVSYNKLRKSTKMPHTTFGNTLKRLKNTQLIASEPIINNEGRIIRVEYFLTELLSVLRRHWGISVRVKSRYTLTLLSSDSVGQDMRESKRKALLLYLILTKAVSGVSGLKNEKSVHAGDIGIRKSSGKGLDPYSSYIEPGVAETDLIGVEFGDTVFSESEVIGFFKNLRKTYPYILQPLASVETSDIDINTRFKIADNRFSEFMKELHAGVFSLTTTRMKRTWEYVRWPDNRDEAIWFISFFYGIKRTFYLVRKALEQRNELERKSNKERLANIKQAEDQITSDDQYMLYHYNRLMSRKYYNIHKKYSKIINPVLEIGYPNFLRELQYRGVI